MEIQYFDPKVELMCRDDLKELQLSRLQRQVERAYYGMPFYKNKFDQIGLKPEHINTLDDLRHIPFIEKKDLRNMGQFGPLAVPESDIATMFMTSGTTGRPVTIALTRNDIQDIERIGARTFQTTGVKPGDVFYQAYGYGPWIGGSAAQWGAINLGCTVIPAGPGRSALAIELLKEMSVTAISTGPGFLNYLLEEAKKAGMDPRKDWKLKIAVQGGEPHTLAAKKKLQKELPEGFISHNIYGATELGGPFVGISCPYSVEQGTMHIWSDAYYLEILDPITGEPCQPGEEGELVFTVLNREAVPLLRWKSKDISAYLEDAHECPCGRNSHLKIKFIEGRTDDMLKIKNSMVFPSTIEEIIKSIEGTGDGWQIIIDKETTTIQEFVVAVEIDENHIGKEKEVHENLHKKIHSITGVRPELKIHKPNELPRYEGKSKRVISTHEYAQLSNLPK